MSIAADAAWAIVDAVASLINGTPESPLKRKLDAFVKDMDGMRASGGSPTRENIARKLARLNEYMTKDFPANQTKRREALKKP